MQHATYDNPLGFEPIPKLLRKFALPAVTSMLVNAVYNIVDQVFIGLKVGYLGNAATTVVFPLMMITLGLATMLGAGGSAYASIRLGEKKPEQAERAMGNVLMMALLFGVIVLGVGQVFMNPILRAFGATDANIGYSRDYAFYILLGMPFSVSSVCMSNLVRTDGRPVLAMASLLTGAILNVFLDWLFVFPLNWGVAGAAAATAISQLVSALLLITYFARFGRMRLSKNALTPDVKVCLKVMNLGISSCLLQMATSIVQIVMNNQLVFYGNLSPVTGDVALSAMGIVLKINQIFMSICIGISIGNQPILGFNRGARQPERIRESYLLAVKVATGVSIIGWLVFMFAPHLVLRLFGSATPAFTEFAAHAMKTFLMCAFMFGFQVVSTGYFQATGQPLKATVLATLRQIVLLLPLILLLPKAFGLDGVLYAGPVADLTAGIVVAVFVILEMKKLDAWIEREKIGRAQASGELSESSEEEPSGPPEGESEISRESAPPKESASDPLPEV